MCPSASFNQISYVRPKVPTLYTALSTGVTANNATIYGVNTNAFVLEKNQVIDIVLNNNDPGKHPFHLHGHNFQAIARSDDDSGNYVGNETFPAVPMRRDTFMVRPNGNIVLRFRADNPDKSPLLLPQTNLKLTNPTHLALPLPHRMARRLRPRSHHDRSTHLPPRNTHNPARSPRRLRRPRRTHRRQRSRQHKRPL